MSISAVLDPALKAKLARYLPLELLNQLPERKALAEAIRHLHSMHQTFSSFLPLYLTEDETLFTQDVGFLRDGTFMFADVSGFTALSERLQKADPTAGAEIMTRIINDYFATMLEIVAKSAGTLLKFAGDALLVFFPADGRGNEARRAIRAGLRMQRAMQARFQPIDAPVLRELIGDHGMELTMSVGIVRGKLFEAMVGNMTQRDHIIQGRLPGQADKAESAGVRDDVIIDLELRTLLHEEFETKEVAEGFFQVLDTFGNQLDDFEFQLPSRRRAKSSALFGFEEAGLLEDLERSLTRVENVARFVAPEVANKLVVSNSDHIESEHRPATVVFVHFTGFAELLDYWGAEHLPRVVNILDRYYALMQRIVFSKGGSLTRSDPYKLGSKLLITFGAPVAHEDDPDRAVATALEMNAQLTLFNERLREELPLELRLDYFPYIRQRMGVSQGYVFAGEVGWRSRREYTVMGDDVNLSARLMGGAEFGDVIISQRVWERVQRFFETEALPPREFKGKSRPVPVYRVKRPISVGVDVDKTSDTPFIGRDALLLTMTLALQQAKGPRRRRAMALYGDAGIGKTRVAQKLAYDATSMGFKVAWVTCRSQDDSKTNWVAVISQLLDLHSVDEQAARRALLKQRLESLNVPYLFSALSDLLRSVVGDPNLEYVVSETQSDVSEDFRAGLYEKLKQQSETQNQAGIFAIADKLLEDKSETPAVSDEIRLWQQLESRTSLTEVIVQFLQAYTKSIPTLLIMDDLHRVNAQALRILNQVVDKIKVAQLVILVTYEPIVNLELAIQSSELTDLRQDETYLMGATVLQASELGPRLAKFLWERTSGRPLFIESLLRALRDQEQVEYTQGIVELKRDTDTDRLPDDVRQLVISQIDRLSEDAKEVLRVAAIWENGFSGVMVLALEKKLEAVDIPRTLADLDRIQILTEGNEAGQYLFRHGVTQATIYESLNRFARQKYHRAAADFWLGTADAPQKLLSIAFHQSRGGLPMRAMELIVNAAGEAEARNDIEEAIDLYTAAKDIFPSDTTLDTQIARLQEKL